MPVLPLHPLPRASCQPLSEQVLVVTVTRVRWFDLSSVSLTLHRKECMDAWEWGLLSWMQNVDVFRAGAHILASLSHPLTFHVF